MIILEYTKKHHKKIISALAHSLKLGKVIAYPTDTSYGLAVDATNETAVRMLYVIKGREGKKPSSVVVPSLNYAKKLVEWNNTASILVKKFWPGALTIALKAKVINRLASKDRYLSLRMPKNQIALDLASVLKKPITATSANISGNKDCYSADDIVRQFKNQKHKPDVILDFGKLTKRKPSTVVKIIDSNKIEVIRIGPISEKEIIKVLQSNLKS